MLCHAKDETVPENSDQLTMLASSQQPTVASKKLESTSSMCSEWARDPQEDVATMYPMKPMKRARHDGGESTAPEGHTKQRTDVLSWYGASYRLNRHGSGVFTLWGGGNTSTNGKVCFNIYEGQTLIGINIDTYQGNTTSLGYSRAADKYAAPMATAAAKRLR